MARFPRLLPIAIAALAAAVLPAGVAYDAGNGTRVRRLSGTPSV
jgi:hypothetical protein